MTNTYGTWLQGDPRGFRTRHHSEHVEGDYKTPPPSGIYEARHEANKRRLSRPPVKLKPEARQVALDAVLVAFIDFHAVELLACCVGEKHMHILARFGAVKKPTPSRGGLRETDPARFYMGIAKERSAKALVAAGLAQPGGVWATRGKIVPIADRSHQLKTFHYILDHSKEGAATWSFNQPRDPKPTP